MAETTEVQNDQPSDYNASNIQLFEGVDAIRIRPAMYVGDPSKAHQQLVEEVVDNSADEYGAGFCNYIRVNYEPTTQCITVSDTGRGIPVDIMPKTGLSALTTVLTYIHAGGKFGSNKEYQSSKGLHGVGLTATNALSSHLEVWVLRRNDKKNLGIWYQSFREGKPETRDPLVLDVNQLPESTAPEVKVWYDSGCTGTIVRFVPDDKLVKTHLSMAKLRDWLWELSFLCPNLKIVWAVSGVEQAAWKQPGGLESLVEGKVAKTGSKPMCTEPFVLNTPEIQIVLQWVQATTSEDVNTYVNRSFCRDGGYHVTGFKKAVTKALSGFAPHNNYQTDDLRLGLIGAFHLRMKDACYGGQTKSKMTAMAGDAMVYNAIVQPLSEYFQRNREVAQALIDRAIKLQAVRQQSKQDKEVIQSLPVTNHTTVFVPPYKSKAVHGIDPKVREVYLCEGLSAAGTLVAASMPYQEVLPLSGKFTNAMRSSMSLTLKNPKIKNILQFVGGVSWNEKGNLVIDISKVRTHRVIFMFDADADGSHIGALGMALWSCHLWEHLKAGMLYQCNAPLFKGTDSKGQVFFGDTLDDVRKSAGTDKLSIIRMKGWGGASADEVRKFACDPATRSLTQLTVNDDTWSQMVAIMGDDVSMRKQLLGVV